MNEGELRHRSPVAQVPFLCIGSEHTDLWGISVKECSRAFSALLLVVALAGCATYDKIKVAPAQTQPLSVAYSNEGASGWTDMPIGAYRVPDSDVIITGHQTNNFGMLFGLVGLAAQDAIQTSEGKSAVKNVQDVLHIDLKPQAADLTEKAIASGRFGQAFSTGTSGPVLTVDPYTVISFVNDTEARPYVVLKATMKSGNSTWTTRYVASSGKPMALSGDNSLTANGGAVLKQLVSENLSHAVDTMLYDVANRPARDDSKMTYVEGYFPFIRPKMGVTGYLLSQDDQNIVFVAKMADATVLGGVYVLDKSAITYRPATKNDSFKTIDDAK